MMPLSREMPKIVRGKLLIPIEERFWAKVAKGIPTIGNPDPCWLWVAGLQGGGYGQLWVNGKHEQSHRISYEFANGDIPDNLEIDHICRVRTCVNPNHLRAVTHKENVLCGESPSAKAVRRNECFRGHSFTEENTYLFRGERNCKICRQFAMKRWYNKKSQDG